MAPILEVCNLTHIYSAGTPFEHTALNDISFAVEPGEFIGVIGHTGSGKSTLMQHLNGLLKPTSGSILLGGKDIWSDKAFTRQSRFRVGLVFQYPEYQLFEETVYKDIAFGPKNMGLKADEIDRRVREAADYPILIFCDCETGVFDTKIPDVNAFAAAKDGEKAAFAFGRKTAAMLRNLGYNVVCNPLIDLVSDRSYPCGGNTRSFGPDKTVIARFGAALARGMHEGGVMAVGKHYPFCRSDTPYDTHMREGYCTMTKEDLCGDAMYALRELMKENWE